MRAERTEIDWRRYRLRVTKDGLKVAAIPAMFGVLMIVASLNPAPLNARFGWAIRPLGEDRRWLVCIALWFAVALVQLWRFGRLKARSER